MSREDSYELSIEADIDLRGIWMYVFESSGNDSIADRVMHRIKEAMALIADEPEAGHVRQDLTDKAIKFWSVFNYLIAYDPSTGPVLIVRIFHGAMDVEHRL